MRVIGGLLVVTDRPMRFHSASFLRTDVTGRTTLPRGNRMAVTMGRSDHRGRLALHEEHDLIV